MKGVGKLAAQVGFYAESIYVSSSAVHRKEGTQAEMAIELFPSWELTQQWPLQTTGWFCPVVPVVAAGICPAGMGSCHATFKHKTHACE